MSNRQGQNADAFDDLLGQLVDELAMTPTMPEEPEEPVHVAPPGGTTVGPLPMDPHGGMAPMHSGGYAPAADMYPPPQSGSKTGIALGIGGGIVVLGGVIAGMLLLRNDPEPPKTPDNPAVEAKADEVKPEAPPPAPGATPQPGVVDPAAVGAAAGALPAVPDVAPPGTVLAPVLNPDGTPALNPDGTPMTAVVPAPGTPPVPGTDPGAPTPAAAKPSSSSKPKKKKVKKAPSKKSTKTANPFG